MTDTPALVQLTTAEPGIVTITLRSPGKITVAGLQECRALHATLQQLAADPTLRAVVLHGAGKAFCAGGDVAAIHEGIADPAGRIGPQIEALHDAVRAIRELPVPVIASVRGAAAGGGFSLAMACDLIVAADTARFVVAYPALGTSSDGGLSQVLATRLGPQRALDLLLLRGALTAAEAQGLGLVARVVADAALETEVAACAAELAAQGPQAVREFKRLVQATDLPAFRAHLELEKAAFLRCAGTPDFAQRVAGFLQRGKG